MLKVSGLRTPIVFGNIQCRLMSILLFVLFCSTTYSYQNYALVLSRHQYGQSLAPFSNERASFQLSAAKRSKNVRIGEVPDEPVKASRPSRYKAVLSGGSKSKRVRNQGVARDREIINPNRLRIIGGTAKGKKINSPDVYLRPMMAKVREAVFSTLGFMGLFDSNTTRVLDIFSGSGSIGLEALSRGACHATFVDFSANCIETALKNAENCGFQHQVSAVCATAQSVLNDPAVHGLQQPYNLITLTPPYEEVVYKELIDGICASPLVTEDTIVILEYPEEMGSLPHLLGEQQQLVGLRNRRYGRTVLGIYVFRPSKILDMRPDEFL